MSEQTITTETDVMDELAEVMADAGISTFGIVTNQTVIIPDDRRAVFARAVIALAKLPNNRKVEMTVDTDEIAEEWRAQVKEYARENGLTAYVPKWSPEHTTPAKVDKNSGKEIPGKLVKDNGVPHHFNVGRHVAFRLTVPSDDEPKNGPVTVTHVNGDGES